MSTPGLLGSLGSGAAGHLQSSSAFGRGIDYGINSLVPNNTFDLNTWTDLFLRGKISYRKYKREALLLGFATPTVVDYVHFLDVYVAPREGRLQLQYQEPHETTDQQVYNRWMRQQTYSPSINELMEMRNRELISPGLFDIYMRKNLPGQENWVYAWDQMRNYIPPVGDWIRYAVREAFNPDLIRKFGYHKEIPTQVLKYVKWLGYDWDLGFAIPNGATDVNNRPYRGTMSPFLLDWFSHWELPSLTQGYDMLHRLYSDSSYGPSPLVLERDRQGNVLPTNTYDPDLIFDPPDLELLQKAQDIPDYWRKKSQAISYLPLTRVDVRRMHKIGAITTDAELYHAYRHIGYNDIDAKRLMRFTILLNSGLDVSPYKRSLAQIKDLFFLGAYDVNSVKPIIAKVGYPSDVIERMVDDWIFDYRAKQTKTGIANLHKTYVHGIIDRSETKRVMTSIGIVENAQDSYLQSWDFERLYSKKPLTTNNIHKMYIRGMIRDPEAATRLYNLEYAAGDVSRMLQLWKLEIAEKMGKLQDQAIEKRNKQLEKERKEKEKRANEIRKQKEKTEKETIAEIKRLRDKLLAAWTEKHLLSAINLKNMSVKEATEILELKGWDNVLIETWLEENKLTADESEE